MPRVRAALVAAVVAVAALATTVGPSAGAPAPTQLRIDGIGPLTLGMTEDAAVATGWLSDQGEGCPLGGPPIPVSYELDGRKAPAALVGSVEFDEGILANFTFSGGVRTDSGVTVKKTTFKDAVKRFKKAGFKASSTKSGLFGGTLLTVRQGKKRVLGGFGVGKKVSLIAIPSIRFCE